MIQTLLVICAIWLFCTSHWIFANRFPCGCSCLGVRFVQYASSSGGVQVNRGLGDALRSVRFLCLHASRDGQHLWYRNEISEMILRLL